MCNNNNNNNNQYLVDRDILDGDISCLGIGKVTKVKNKFRYKYQIT